MQTWQRNGMYMQAVEPAAWRAHAQVAEAAPVHADDSSPNGGGNGSAAAAPAAEDHPSRCAPSEVLEDGALIYSMELLQALSYEDVLAP